MSRVKSVCAAGVLLVCARTAFADAPADNVVFMQPAESPGGGDLPLYAAVKDDARLAAYRERLNNSAARRALQLYELAWKTAHHDKRGADEMPPFCVALVPGGNNADAGFRLRDGGAEQSFPERLYIKLDPSGDGFDITFLHETGHVALALLGLDVEARKLAAIPHSTAALSDRVTAFNEGFSIHLETLAVQLADDPRILDVYRHARVEFGQPQLNAGEFYRPLADIRTYSQTLARYYDVRENYFAFAEACAAPDYLRVQLDKSRDFAVLRDANQLLQSEGFYASFFYAWTMRGTQTPVPEQIWKRTERMFCALARLFSQGKCSPETPFLLDLIRAYMELYPDEKREMIDAFLDLSRGVFVDAQAASLWREAYEATLRIESGSTIKSKLETARKLWREKLTGDFSSAYTRLGPQIRCGAPSVTVTIAAFGRGSPLSFDVNTVQPGVMRLIPGVTEADVQRWMSERAKAPFAGVEDFKARGAAPGYADQLQFDS